MKKVFSLLLTVLLLVSALCACGDNAGKNSSLTSSPWTSIYTNNKLIFNSDHTMSIGSSQGTWTQDGDVITATYTVSSGSTMEMTLDLIQGENSSCLRKRETGKENGTVFNWSEDEYYPEEAAAEMKAALAKNLGETVSTDIIDLTVEKAEFSNYGDASNTTLWATPLEEDTGGIFSTSKGRTFVALTFTVTNKDRATIDIGNSWDLNWKISYHDTSFIIHSFDLNSKDGSAFGLDLGFAAISIDGGDTFKKYDASNYLLHSGQSITIRLLGVVVMEPDSLSDGFDLVVNVLNSDSEDEKFIYKIG